MPALAIETTLTNSPIYIFAGGGTGGHLYPGIAVAEALVGMVPAARVVFACSHRPVDRRILDQTDFAAVPQPLRPMPRGLRGWWGFAGGLLSGQLQGRAMIEDLRPAAVLGLGGFAAMAVVRAAAKAGTPAAMLNPDAVPGVANRHLARHCDVIFTQFESTQDCFRRRLRQSFGEKVRCLGCPVRSSLLGGRRDEAIDHFHLGGGKKTLLVFGASLGATSINEAISALAGELDELAESWQLLHVTGSATAAGALGRMQSTMVEYCDRMDLAYAAADLALCRGGASTVAELAATATPAVILPYPHHRDQQQKLNAASLVAAGAAVVCEDAIDARANADRIGPILIALMKDQEKLSKMRAAAGATAKLDAARTVAQWLADKSA